MAKKTMKKAVKKTAKKVAKKLPAKAKHIKVTLIRLGDTVTGKILEQSHRRFGDVVARGFSLRSESYPSLYGDSLFCRGDDHEASDSFSRRFANEKEAIKAVAGIVACVAEFNGKREVVAGSPLVSDAMTIG
jgi:hypothetical protein